ncbi:F-box/LRR-repeat protein 2 [Hondaea fermentalgiana]|uniref:F-box/LRR-repeat protein 2 n=1 Tax=Hondaea fermentalgiana TaxID=2315210 RepID=A0A2R5GDT2_9STRA|nr:F-box/LRR-repeat protein 2 [Hondaea fermentalgiana]|eukprot:GBG29092.1 F-box/LRR-repeat protein 2 [Hondaea fermentalgiana]
MAAKSLWEGLEWMMGGGEGHMDSHVDVEDLVAVCVHDGDSTSSKEQHDNIEDDDSDHDSLRGVESCRCCFPTRREQAPKRVALDDLVATNYCEQVENVQNEIAEAADHLVGRQGLLPSGTVMLKPKGKGTEDGARTFYDAGLKVDMSMSARDELKPFFTHEHVREIEKGAFLYDPMLVQSVVDVGKRLANLDSYISDGDDHKLPMKHPQKNQIRYIDSRMTEVLLNDLEDFLQVISKMLNKMEFLREVYTSKHVEIMQAAKDARAALTKEKGTVPLQEHQVQDDSLGNMGTGRQYAMSTTSMKSRVEAKDETSRFPFLWWVWSVVTSFFLAVGDALWWNFNIVFLPSLFKKRLDRKYNHIAPRVYAIPHTFLKRKRQRVYGATFDAFLEITNLGSDFAFLIIQLRPLLGTANAFLYVVSLAALILTFALRFLIGLWEWRMVDWKDKTRKRKYLFGVLLAIIEPNTGFNDLVKESFKIQESLSYNVIGDTEDSFVKDPIATQAKADFKAAKMSILTAFVLLIQDIPQIVVEFIFILTFEGGHFEFVYWLALISSLVSAGRQLIEAVELLHDVPGLRNIVYARHLVLEANHDIDLKLSRALQTEENNRDQRASGTKAFSKAGTYDEGVEFHGGTKLVAKTLCRYFNFDYGPNMNRYLRRGLWLVEFVIKVALAAPTLGHSLLWEVPNLASYRAIRSLDLTDCISTNDEILKVISAMCPNLQNLNLSFCVNITDKGLRYFEDNRCITLGSVVLDGCIKIKATGVGHVIRSSKRSLWRLSLRDLPDLKVEVLDDIAKYCTALRSLNLDVDALFKEREGKDAFLSIQESKPLIELVKRCSLLQTLKLGNVLAWDKRPLEDWKEFAEEVNPYIRVLSLEGAKSFTDECLVELSAKTRFLRELRLSGAEKLMSAGCLERYCHSLQTISLGETFVKLADADAFFESVEMPDLEVAQIDHPQMVFRFYLEQLDLQLEYYDAPSTSSQKPPSCWPCIRSHSSEEDGDSFSHEDKVSSRIDLIRQKRKELEHFAGAVIKYNDQASMVFLTLVVSLVDFVRRARFRKELTPETRCFMYPDMEDRDCKQCDELLEMISSVIVANKKAGGLRGIVDYIGSSNNVFRKLEPMSFLQSPECSPVVALPTFGIMPTRRLNLKIDFRWNKYEFICPDNFDSIYTLWKPENSVVSRMTGPISKIWPITVRASDASNTRLLQRFWYIPPEARYFCYAFPLDNLGTGVLDWFDHQRYDDTVLRFLHYGGFLYFDEQRHFVSASALTVGIALSFVGPYKLPKGSVDMLARDERWSEVTVNHLKPKDATKVEFCFVFGGEVLLPEEYRKFCPHGGFAYRIQKDNEKPYGVLYPLAPVRDVFLRDKDAPLKEEGQSSMDSAEDPDSPGYD